MEVHRGQGISKVTQQIVGFVPEAFSEHQGEARLGTGHRGLAVTSHS